MISNEGEKVDGNIVCELIPIIEMKQHRQY